MKNAIAATVLSLSALAHAAPSADNFASVTNDWYQGNWTRSFDYNRQFVSPTTVELGMDILNSQQGE